MPFVIFLCFGKKISALFDIFMQKIEGKIISGKSFDVPLAAEQGLARVDI